MKIKDIVKETTASSIASVVTPVGGLIKRNDNTFKNALDTNDNLMGGPSKKKKKKKTDK